MIGARIKELRTDRGISQRELGKAIGVSQKAVDYWERGVNEPKASYITLNSADGCMFSQFFPLIPKKPPEFST